MSKKDELTEQDLQDRLRSPEYRRSAFGELVRRHSSQIYWQLRRMVYSHEDANDLVQNTFLKAWEGLDSFRGDSKLSTWLYQIALREGLNFLKKLKRKPSAVSGEVCDEELAEILISRLEADDFFAYDEYEVVFQRAILSLPERQQQVFRWRYYDEMPYEDMAQLTGTSVGALKASYHHAYNKVVKHLKQSLIVG